MLRGYAALKVSLHVWRVLRAEAEERARTAPTPATQAAARQTVEQIDRLTPTLIGALAHVEMFPADERDYDMPCRIEVFDLEIDAA